MKTIVRLEYTDGNGIFTAVDETGTVDIDSLHSKVKDIHARHKLFPTPYKDNIDITKEHYCAFKSIEQLQQWLTSDEIKEFITLGFKVLMLDVSDYLEGDYQICFKKCDIVQSKDISQLFV